MSLKIGVFDSGIGGITVLAELMRQLPGADFVYLGDTAHVPYGTRSPQQIRRLSADCARILRKKKVDALVVACNTASSLALKSIQEVMGKVPVFGVVGPGADAALEGAGSVSKRSAPPILVLATRATVRSRAYGKLLQRKLAGAGSVIIEQACPLLVPMIEEGWIDHPILHETIKTYVEPHFRAHAPGVALLGCTHYPWIQKAFETALPGWKVVNSARAVAETLSRFRPSPSRKKGKSKVEWIFSDPAAVPEFAREMIRAGIARAPESAAD